MQSRLNGLGMQALTSPSTITKTSASISSLPLEIKSLIVRLAQLQDENYRSRSRAVNQHVKEVAKGVLKDNEWRGRSLNALFLLNKEWSDLAAVELFKSISTRRINTIVFKFIVLSRRANLVKTLGFIRQINSSDALMLLPAFTNLSTLHFHAPTIQHLFSPSTHTSSSDTEVALLALSNRRISGITFVGCSAKAIITVLQACHRLIAVEIVGNAEGTIEELNLLGEILANYSLQRFSLIMDEALPGSWSELTWKSSSTMSCLLIRPDVFNSSFLDFLSIFSNSLKRLHIYFSESELSDAEELPIFNKLQHLELELTFSTSLRILKFLKNSPLVSLQLIFLNMWYDEQDESDIDKIIQLIKQIPTLQEIEIITRFIDPTPFSKLIDYCNLQNIIIKYTQWTSYPTLEYPNYPPTNEDKMNHFEPILETALADGQMKLKELRKDKDVDGMEEMFNNCKWLRANSAYMRD